MNSTAMTNAARVGFPRDRMMYVTFGAAEEDMYPAGDSAIGTYAVANALPARILSPTCYSLATMRAKKV
jgi:branched-chain amino acid transport system substrate-binding protein